LNLLVPDPDGVDPFNLLLLEPIYIFFLLLLFELKRENTNKERKKD
jgi:hypothetical protein